MRKVRKNTEPSNKKAPSFTARLDAQASVHNTGIDLLRLVSMLFVVILHLIGDPGGILYTTAEGTIQYMLCILMQAIAYCAVDIFALISGYVSYSDKPKPVRTSSFIQMWLLVAGYSLVIAVVFFIVRPDLISLKNFVLPFFPITGDLYWYYTAYAGLFLLMPLLNAGLRHTPKRTLRVMLIAMFAAFSVYNSVCDRFKLEAGYATVWLILMYILGGVMKKCEIGKRIKPWTAFLGIALLAGINWAWRMFGFEISVIGVGVDRKTLFGYTSPTIILSAVLYLIAFSKLRFGKHAKRLVAFAAPCAFSVYLIHMNPLIAENLLKGHFEYLIDKPLFVFAGTLLGLPIAIVAASVLIDRVRLLLFDLLHIRQATDALDRALHAFVRKRISND